jgi:hypothetical protein
MSDLKNQQIGLLVIANLSFTDQENRPRGTKVRTSCIDLAIPNWRTRPVANNRNTKRH